ncbi:MAG TPA: cupin domain-containing protein [Limnobacter sp.]|nr:cupin domain-containing protein [Limnobacter sp.]
MIEPLRQISGVDVAQFMREDWHIRPRLFRQAFPMLQPLCDLETIADMASDPDIESRLIRQGKQGWQLEHGPFEKLPSLKTKGWTVLVQGIDHHLPEAYDLLQQFRFVPDARLDDVMLSLASDTGGVGPHYDSYDVFLLQMHGTRRWQIGPLQDASLQANCPLKILEHFEPTEEYILEPGDMLYLPPNYGHDGVAQGVCSTLSIGFRAPTQAEMLAATLRDLADQVEHLPNLRSTLFSDPARGHSDKPAELPDDMLSFAHQLLQQFKPQSAQILRSVGIQLTEPKPHVYFENNTEDMQLQEIVHVLGERGIALSMKTKMLYKESVFFINGEQIEPKDPEACKLLQLLANRREMASTQAIAALQNFEFQYFLVGFAKAGWVETLT